MLAFYMSLANSDEERALVEFLYTEYRQTMFKTALNILHNKSDAEDIVHDAFLRIIKNISKFKDYSCKENTSYVVMIVKGLSLNLLKKRKDSNLLEEIAQESSLLEDVVETKLKYEEVLQKMKQLSPALRTVATLYFSRGLHPQEIAELLDIKLVTVYSSISRARKAIIDTNEEQESENE